MRLVDVMTMDRGGEVHESLSHIAALPPWVGNGRAGALDTSQVGTQPIEREPRHTTPLTCSFTSFYDHNVMLPNGDVVLCCMDYSVKHKIGNLLTGSYWSLFVSDGMNALREANMHYGETDSICRRCTRAITYDRKPGANQFWEPRE
jgi:hypothetical protein